MNDPDHVHQVVVTRLVRQLYGFAQGLGLDEQATRGIVNQVINDMPTAPDDDRLARARDRMLIASA
ncbi:hypothetical protein MKK88_02425 [Methylobacterium sp. E-005]|uniref:hypothetical protein n=1 Tax=Methylobacterium sp. E-005 TaxID=2836549 RepID=UPI001FBB6E0A|nr:hypothetical protein [Methylobacterium sp. E-005]MCJ2084849.1 hypothetical protein [Methylobacterium sp. E-005]